MSKERNYPIKKAQVAEAVETGIVLRDILKVKGVLTADFDDALCLLINVSDHLAQGDTIVVEP